MEEATIPRKSFSTSAAIANFSGVATLSARLVSESYRSTRVNKLGELILELDFFLQA